MSNFNVSDKIGAVLRQLGFNGAVVERSTSGRYFATLDGVYLNPSGGWKNKADFESDVPRLVAGEYDHLQTPTPTMAEVRFENATKRRQAVSNSDRIAKRLAEEGFEGVNVKWSGSRYLATWGEITLNPSSGWLDFDHFETDVPRMLWEYKPKLVTVTVQHDNVTINPLATATATNGAEALEVLLQAASGVNPGLAELARVYVDNLQRRAEHEPGKTAGRYRRRVTGVDRAPIAWQQPDARIAPLYSHDVHCPYCGRAVTVESHSPKSPKVCERESCRIAHERNLATERQRRLRERQRANRE